MRIGLVTEEYDPWASPVASQVHHFAREARRLGHIVKVLTGDTSRLSPQPFPTREPGRAPVQALVPAAERDVIRVARSRPVLRRGRIGWVTGGLGAGRALREVLARERLDVVHVHSPLAPALPLLALHHATGPVVGTFHGPCAPGLWGRFLEGQVGRLLDRLDAAVVTARASLPGLPERIRGELRVIPWGVDVEGLTRGYRARGLADGRLNVLCAAGERRRGDLSPLLEAVGRAQRSLELRLLVLGDDPFAPRGRTPVPCAPEGAEVRFVPGRSEDRATWYATADVCCVPFPAGPAVLEAMAAGKPVLAVDVPEHRELLRHGWEGELLPPQDPGAWAYALVRLVREPLRGAVYGERGRATSQRYAWPAVAREILNLYRAIGVRG